jgi:hypothetical protein
VCRGAGECWQLQAMLPEWLHGILWMTVPSLYGLHHGDVWGVCCARWWSAWQLQLQATESYCPTGWLSPGQVLQWTTAVASNRSLASQLV